MIHPGCFSNHFIKNRQKSFGVDPNELICQPICLEISGPFLLLGDLGSKGPGWTHPTDRDLWIMHERAK